MASCLLQRSRSARAKRSPSFRPLFEQLECRALLAALASNADVYDPDHVLIQFEPGYNPIGKLPAAASIKEALPLADNLYVVDVPVGWTVPQLLAAAAANPHVRLAQPDYEVSINLTPNDPFFSSEWGLHNSGQSGGIVDADIDAPEAWDISTGSGSIIVAVIDTGIDYNHPDLADNLWTNAGEIAGNNLDDDDNGFIDDVHGFNFVANTGNALDDNSHGTHVAGTIGAVGNNGIGIAGVAFDVQLMAVKFLNSSGSGSTSNAIKSLNYAVAQGAKISNNSWGGGGFNSALSSAINSARAAGHIFVAAAGNSGTDNDTTPFYPASYTQDNVVAVTATSRIDALASFSNYGDSSVDLAAPGLSIYSTLPGGGYGYKSGTSMAAPHVTGALAVVWDVHPDWTYSQVIEEVLGSVDVLPALSGKVATGGRLNLANALGDALPPPPPPPPTPTISVENASLAEGHAGTTIFTFTVSLSPASTDTVTVNYATASGSAAADSDYTPAIGTLTFAPGETTQTITVEVAGDTEFEANETFLVNLSEPTGGAVIGDAQAVGTIVNDDAAPLAAISINDVSQTLSKGGTSFIFTVTLAETNPQTVAVNYATANGTLTSPSGYNASSGTLTFSPGQTSKTIAVRVKKGSPGQYFVVNLSSPTNGTLLDSQGIGTIAGTAAVGPSSLRGPDFASSTAVSGANSADLPAESLSTPRSEPAVTNPRSGRAGSSQAGLVQLNKDAVDLLLALLAGDVDAESAEKKPR